MEAEARYLGLENSSGRAISHDMPTPSARKSLSGAMLQLPPRRSGMAPRLILKPEHPFRC
jgi:hypothetical protein